MTLSEREKHYVENKGVSCPFCGSTNLTTGGIEITEEGAHQGVICFSCNAEWTDLFTLSGIRFEECNYTE